MISNAWRERDKRLYHPCQIERRIGFKAYPGQRLCVVLDNLNTHNGMDYLSHNEDNFFLRLWSFLQIVLYLLRNLLHFLIFFKLQVLFLEINK